MHRCILQSFKALKELRQEASLTSRLQHPCIVALVGVAFSPRLMMALELAPLGSLRSVLDQHGSDRPVFNKYAAVVERLAPVFDKLLTFKFVHQVKTSRDSLYSISRKSFVSKTF